MRDRRRLREGAGAKTAPEDTKPIPLLLVLDTPGTHQGTASRIQQPPLPANSNPSFSLAMGRKNSAAVVLWCSMISLCLCLSFLSGVSAISTICFEQISTIPGLYLQEHPGRGKAVIGTQEGKMTLVQLPPVGSTAPAKTLGTWLDLSSRVKVGGETGLLSFAFHPNFPKNGRFFVSYTCDSTKHPDCQGFCGCNSDVGCKVGQKNAACTSNTVIAEYGAAGHPLSSTSVGVKEVRRILTFARPYNNHNGGHIFFGKDGNLWFTSGDGGNQGDPWNMAQNGKSYFGKVLRMNVNARTNGNNYSIPPSNPFRGQGMNDLVFALGLRNPWRADQDIKTGAVVVGDVGGSLVEEVNLIRAGGNYGWHNFEGTIHRVGTANTSKLLGKYFNPIFSYTHQEIGGACVIGGVFYRAAINKCLQGKYFYSDHSGAMWLSTIYGEQSTARVSFTCTSTSPIKCPDGGDGSNGEWGGVYSWSKDISQNAYLLTEAGVFRVTNQAKCNISC